MTTPRRTRPPTAHLLRVVAQMAVDIAATESLREPHRVFYFCGLRLQGHKGIASFALFTDLDQRKPKYTLAMISNGIIIPRASRMRMM